jgi:hypothetical protein
VQRIQADLQPDLENDLPPDQSRPGSAGSG